MNKKRFIAFFAIVALIALGVWLFIRLSRPSAVDVPTNVLPTQTFPPQGASVTPSVASPVSVGGSSIITTASTSRCSEGSVFDQNDCATKVAQSAQDPSLCSSIHGTLARASCLRAAQDVVREPVASPLFVRPKNTYESFMSSYVASSAPSSIQDIFSQPVQSAGFVSRKDPASDSGARYNDTIQAFWARSANEAALAVYTVFPYQSRPGDSVNIQGSGFALSATNVVHIGGTNVSGLASTDGMNLSVVIPPSAVMGSSEVWVTNDRGSTRSSERPIFAVISSNPVPAPQITSVSPANPSSSDTITLSGTHLGGLVGVYTTFGQSKTGTSLSFRVSDLERSWLVLKDESYKGKKIPLYVYVQAEGGLSKDPFIFDVQY